MRLPPRHGRLVAVSISTIRRAEVEIVGCEACDAGADIPFHFVLGGVTEAARDQTAYIMSEPAKCQRCQAAVFEETLVGLTQLGKRRGQSKRAPKFLRWF